jgi:type I restriction enzyme R subunit
MNELYLQDKYLVNFLCERQDGLQYKEAKANTCLYINKQIKINAVTLTHKDFSELFRATNEQLLIRFRNYSATQQQQKRTVKRRYYKNLIVVFSYRILSFFTFTPPIQNTPQ